MKIDRRIINRYWWYEDINGNEIIPDIDNTVIPKVPENAATSHTLYPLEVTEHVDCFENGKFTHAYDSNVHLSAASEEVIVAMVNSGDFTLSEAIFVYSQACERCMNVLSYKYLGKDGYPEYSEEWRKCNTVCDFCRHENTALVPAITKVSELITSIKSKIN